MICIILQKNVFIYTIMIITIAIIIIIIIILYGDPI
jgi:hypothetical protein